MSQESISIEETNRIRVSLGLKPIPLPNETKQAPKNDEISLDDTNKLRISLGLKPITKDNVSNSNGKSSEEYQQEIRNREKEERIKKNLEIAKSRAAKRKKINISKSLLDENDQDDDGDDWLNGGMSGVKVGHSIDDINQLQQEDVILTLKDRSIHDDEDELESDLLVKKQKLEKQMAEKLRTNKYKKSNGLESEEKTLLERYNEELNGENGESFILNGETIQVDKRKEAETVEKTGKRRMEFSLDDDDDGDEDEIMGNSDYAKAKPIKMKKLKKKSGNGRKKEERKDEEGDVVALESVELKDEDSSIQDDFELQNALALKRLKNHRKRKNLKPEDIAKEINEDKENGMNVDNVEQGIVIDENTEFLSSIRARKDEEEEPKDEKIPLDNETVEEEEDAQDVNFNGGIGSLLGFLKSKNIVQEKTSDQIESDRKAKELKKKLDLEKLKTEIEKRIYEENLREDSSFKKLSKKEREEVLESELQQFKDLQNSEEIASKLENYKPQVKLRYIDEYGREMNTKEAYKHLSHQFHGKGPNKSKIAKKLKKVEEERKQQYKENSLLGGLSNDNKGDQDSSASQDKVGVRLQ
ncbi:unnamed protein product [Wickerhamomyces anomalus]